MYNKAVIIDDSSLDRMLTEKMIRMNSFAKEVVSFDSVRPALDYLELCAADRSIFPDFIFLDIQMPEMDGFDFLDRFSGFPATLTRECRVATLSSSIAIDDRLRAETYPTIYKFFNKPLMLAHLSEL